LCGAAAGAAVLQAIAKNHFPLSVTSKLRAGVWCHAPIWFNAVRFAYECKRLAVSGCVAAAGAAVLRLQSKSAFLPGIFQQSSSAQATCALHRPFDGRIHAPKPAREFSAGTAELGLAAKSARSGAGIDGLQVQAIRPETAPIC
jgi:hypothetical protein